MATTLNPYTGQFEDASPNVVPEKIALVAPDGNEQIVDAAAAAGLMKAGYRPETDQDVRERKLKDEESLNTGQAFGEGIGRGVTFGLSDVVLNKLIRTPDEVERARVRKEENPIASFGGEATGFATTLGASALARGGGALVEGAAKMLPMNLAGEAGESLAAKALASKAAQKYLTNEALRTATKLGLESAVETGAYSAGDALSEESFKADSDLTSAETAEAVLSSGLLGGVFGGLLGGGLSLAKSGLTGPVGKIFGRADKQILSDAEKVALKDVEAKVGSGELSSGDAHMNLASQFGEKKAADIISQSNLQDEYAKSIRGNLKPNADRIVQAHAELGLPPPTMGELSDSGMARAAHGLLQQDVSPVGQMFREKEVAPLRNALDKEVSARAAGEAEASQSARAGEEALTKKADEFGKRKADFKDVYDKIRAAQSGEFIGDEQDFLKNTAKDLRQSKYVTSGSDAGKILEEFAGRIEKAPTLDALDLIERDLGGRIKEVSRSGRGDLVGALSDLRNQLEEGRLDVVGRNIKDPQLIEDFKKVRPEYAKYKQDLENFGRQTGLGKVYDPSQILEKIHGSDSYKGIGFEKWTDGLISRFEDNAQFRDYLKNNHPDVYKTALDQAKAKFRESTLFDGRYDLKKAMSYIKRRLDVPAQNEILGEGAAKTFENFKIIGEARPEIYNPSKSGLVKHVIDLATGSPMGIVHAAGASAMYGMIALKNMQSSVAKEIDETMGKYFKTLVTEGSKQTVLNKLAVAGEKGLGSELGIGTKSFHKQVEAVLKASENLEEAHDIVNKKIEGLSIADSDLSTALSVSTMRAIQYLHDSIPRAAAGGPLDPEEKHDPSLMDKYKFQKKFEAATNPFSVLKDLANGNLVPEKVEALKAVYPELYTRMVKNGVSQLAAKRHLLSYPQKQQLSILMETPMTKTLDPAYIQLMQNTWAGADQTKPGEKPLQGQGSGSHTRKPNFETSTNSIAPASSAIRKRSLN